MPQIAVKISEPIFAKLKRLAHQGQTNYATIVEAALSAYEPSTSEASESSEEIHLLIESALEPVLARLEMLESMGIFKHQHLSGVTAQISLHNAPEIAVAASGIPEVGSAEKGAEIGLESAIEALPEEEAAPFPSISSLPEQPLPPIETAIKELGRQGHGQQAIAHELNRRGYRTVNGTLIQRGYVGNRLKSLGI